MEVELIKVSESYVSNRAREMCVCLFLCADMCVFIKYNADVLLLYFDYLRQGSTPQS